MDVGGYFIRTIPGLVLQPGFVDRACPLEWPLKFVWIKSGVKTNNSKFPYVYTKIPIIKQNIINLYGELSECNVNAKALFGVVTCSSHTHCTCSTCHFQERAKTLCSTILEIWKFPEIPCCLVGGGGWECGEQEWKRICVAKPNKPW